MQFLFFIKSFLIAFVLTTGAFIFISMYKPFGKNPDTDKLKNSPQFQSGRFINPRETETGNFSDLPDIIRRSIKNDVEKQPQDGYSFQEERSVNKHFSADNLLINWLGHASLLIHHQGKYILTDPAFSDRASPFGFLGPKRFFKTPISIEDLPPIEAVIISHDHYDHLDYESIVRLAHKVHKFIVPLGVGATLQYWEIPEEKIVELDWWEKFRIENFHITATPARHFSGRLFKRNNTLWNSYAIRTGNKKMFFAGDSGFFKKYEEIGEKEGPFDISFIPIGAYDPAWSDIHLNPEEAVKTHQLLNGGQLLPIHWGTYNLGLHSWYEPMERLTAAADKENIRLLTPKPGRWIHPGTYESDWFWWQKFSKKFQKQKTDD